ncbi:hypothetical protein FJZ31_41590 [Candidatus Poribacteria bacterium]|nr:hypothetical protein [Candidatus Poribacteria bacterium]
MPSFYHDSLSQSSGKIGFVTKRQVAEGALADDKVIIAPPATHVTDVAFGGLRNYVALGGKIVTVGDDYWLPKTKGQVSIIQTPGLS